MRRAWFSYRQQPDYHWPNISNLVHAVEDLECYQKLHNTKTAKQTIRKLLTDWSNFHKARRAYAKDQSQFLTRPKPPNYKEELAQVIFYSETIKRKPLKSGIIEPTNALFAIRSSKVFKQVVVTPKTFGFVIEVQYEVPQQKHVVDKNKVCCIDLGVNNLCAITSDQHLPLLINGCIPKSINQWYNKNKSKKQSEKRYWRLENYFHHTSKLIIANCLRCGIGTIVIGKNDGWKTEMNMGHATNQTFQSIPHNNLIQKIQYKAKQVGIQVLLTEEAYTSKASFLDRDSLPKYSPDEQPPQFSGKRIKRGLYKSKNGTLLNADVNGSGNIGRKVIPNSTFGTQWDRSLAARPVRINPLIPVGEEPLVDSPNSQTCRFLQI